MNLLIKSSILALLASASGVYASSIGEQTGIRAANDIVDQHWCLNQRSRASSGRSFSNEERARQIAIRTCKSETTIRNAINALCPNDGTPRSKDIIDLGNRCERTVNSLIGFPGDAQFNEASFVATSKASKQPSNPTLEGREAGQQAIRDLWEGRRFRSNCRSRNVRNFKRQAKLIDSQFPENTGSSTTRAFNRAARRAAEREISNIESECSPRPTPHPDGFVDGQNAMQQWYKDEGNTCANAWSGIINPAANEIKNSQFPMRGSRSTRAFNQNARAGIDHEVKTIQEKCFSANEMAAAEEASFVASSGSGAVCGGHRGRGCPQGERCGFINKYGVGMCIRSEAEIV